MKLNPKFKRRDHRKTNWLRRVERDWDFIDPAVRRDVRQSGGFVPRQRGTYKNRMRRNNFIDYMDPIEGIVDQVMFDWDCEYDYQTMEAEIYQLEYHRQRELMDDYELALIHEAIVAEAEVALAHQDELDELMNPFPFVTEQI